ncbi:hypothetical protein [Microbulbifer sp. JMSA002]|uniref:hypothetical protein n=1 Tax=Microbulbifer sp. JMSA002 TaxID=3243368 RepID=UPI0040393A14
MRQVYYSGLAIWQLNFFFKLFGNSFELAGFLPLSSGSGFDFSVWDILGLTIESNFNRSEGRTWRMK